MNEYVEWEQFLDALPAPRPRYYGDWIVVFGVDTVGMTVTIADDRNGMFLFIKWIWSRSGTGDPSEDWMCLFVETRSVRASPEPLASGLAIHCNPKCHALQT